MHRTTTDSKPKAAPLLDMPEPVLLIIADISGYTRYMTANVKTLAHSQTIITELVKALIQQIELPLEVAKLEGDAIFLFCRKQKESPTSLETKRMIGNKLLTFFQIFTEKVDELSQSTTCTCNACTHIERLRLKVIVHSGEALFHRVLNFVELAGVDVIIVHRLLKNSIDADQYLLLTEAAQNDLVFPPGLSLSKGVETYEEIGDLNTLVYRPGGELNSGNPPRTLHFSERFARAFQLYWKLWLAPLSSFGLNFQNVESHTSTTVRVLFGLLTLLLTPIFVPVGTIFVFAHALQTPRSPDHEHVADGSCCHKH
jgi:hypothetical protein